MVRKVSKVKIQSDDLTLIEGDFSNKEAIAKTLLGATYVVSMGQGPMGKPSAYPKDMMLNYFKLLSETIKETAPSVKVVLYQGGAFSPLPDKPLPLTGKVAKFIVGGLIMGIGPNIEDNTNVISYVYEEKDNFGFRLIVSRPSALEEKEADGVLPRELKVVDDAPMSPITFAEVAAWSLKAIKDESLYGTFPFLAPV